MINSNRKALFFGTFAAVTSIIDWYLNAPLRNKPFTEHERFIFEHFLENPKRVILPPDLSPLGVAYFLVFLFGIFFMGSMCYRNIGLIIADCRALNSLYLNLVRIFALLTGTYVSCVFCYVEHELPPVMKMYCAAAIGMTVYLWMEVILGLPYRLFQRGKNSVNNHR
jgi:hypothetical protein